MPVRDETELMILAFFAVQDVIKYPIDFLTGNGLGQITCGKAVKGFCPIFAAGSYEDNGDILIMNADLSGGLRAGQAAQVNLKEEDGKKKRLINIQKRLCAWKMPDIELQMMKRSIAVQDLLQMVKVRGQIVHNGNIQGVRPPL